MSPQTAAETAPTTDPLALPRQMLDAALKSATLSPKIWHEGCALLAEAAEEQAKFLHLLAGADTPVAAAAIMSDYWQSSAQRGFAAMTWAFSTARPPVG